VDIIGVNNPLPIYANVGDSKALPFQELGRLHDSVVLNGGGDNMITPGLIGIGRALAASWP
jgi:hypothetical protein